MENLFFERDNEILGHKKSQINSKQFFYCTYYQIAIFIKKNEKIHGKKYKTKQQDNTTLKNVKSRKLNAKKISRL